MGIWLKDQLISLGVTDTKLVELGDTEPILQLPPLVAGRLDTGSRKTVFIYGHYDVQPVSASCQLECVRDQISIYPLQPQADPAAWEEQNPESTDPFLLKRVKEGDTYKLVGRGSTDDKGPITGWLNVLEAHQKLGLKLPVNVRFLFEGMEESGSVKLDDWIEKEAEKRPEGFFGGVDCACIVSISGRFSRWLLCSSLMFCLQTDGQLLAHYLSPGADLRRPRCCLL
jgi:Cys-Gly metallodipeptidase DUG1